MNLIGNVIWLIFGGLVTGVGYILGGISMLVTIIGIPFGLQAIKLGAAALMPFGRQIRNRPGSGGFLETLFNVIWLILFGWEIALAHLLHGLLLAITIIGLPFAKQHFKMIPLALFPFGKELI
jgi:uncharacterized membrane protein YccF (DUF307 family)